MGAVESKKNGIIKRYELRVDLTANVKNELLPLLNWNFSQIKLAYDVFTRKAECPFIDFFIFHKMMPFSKDLNRIIFDSYSEGDKYINAFEILAILILVAHNTYRKKLQLLFVMFDFEHKELLQNRQLILIFETMVYGICRITGQGRPKYEYLSKYTIERFIRVNTLEALEKIVNYRRLIEEIQGNNDAFDLFKRFDQEQYSYFKQESFLFMVSQYHKYTRSEVQKNYRIIKKVNAQANYQQIELIDKNRRFRLENRKISCIKQLQEEKQQKFKVEPPSKINFTLRNQHRANSVSKVRSNSISFPKVSSTRFLRSNISDSVSKLPTSQLLRSNSKLHKQHTKVMFLNGQSVAKEDIFQTITYFKTLSNNQKEIKIKEFFKGFQKKVFMKKQLSSFFRFFDKQKKGQISFREFLKSFYPGIKSNQIQQIVDWYAQYKDIHEADAFDINEFTKKKQKKNSVQLPRQTLKRIEEIFMSIDRDKKGYLSFEDMKQAYNTGFTIKQVENMMKDFGKNNRIYKEQFIRMVLPEEWTIQGTQFIGY